MLQIPGCIKEKCLDQVPVTVLVGSAGFAIGAAYEAVTRWADFCALGAIADVSVNGDYRRLRTWLLAITTATIGVSGAPGGDLDDACARAGIESNTEKLEF